MKAPKQILDNERGSLVVIAVVILMLLTLIGISITTTTSTELQIAGNEKLQKTAFYEADGGTEVGAEIVEQNLGCVGAPGGFTEDVVGDDADESSDTSLAVKVVNQGMWQNEESDAFEPWDQDTDSGDYKRDFYFPDGYTTDQPHTNVKLGGDTTLSSGAAIQMVAGYEGKGKGAGGGGGYIVYNMYTKRIGVRNSTSTILVQWRHVIGQEGACNY